MDEEIKIQRLGEQGSRTGVRMCPTPSPASAFLAHHAAFSAAPSLLRMFAVVTKFFLSLPFSRLTSMYFFIWAKIPFISHDLKAVANLLHGVVLSN